MDEKSLLSMFDIAVKNELKPSQLYFFLSKFINSYSDIKNVSVSVTELEDEDTIAEAQIFEINTRSKKIRECTPSINFNNSFIEDTCKSNLQVIPFIKSIYNALHELRHIQQIKTLSDKKNRLSLNIASENIYMFDCGSDRFYDKNYDLCYIEIYANNYASAQTISIIENILVPSTKDETVLKSLYKVRNWSQRRLVEGVISNYVGMQFGTTPETKMRNKDYNLVLQKLLEMGYNGKEVFPILNLKFDENNKFKDLSTLLKEKKKLKIQHKLIGKSKFECDELDDLYGQMFFDYMCLNTDASLTEEKMNLSDKDRFEVIECVERYITRSDSNLTSILNNAFPKLADLDHFEDDEVKKSNSEFITEKEKKISGILVEHGKMLNRTRNLFIR